MQKNLYVRGVGGWLGLLVAAMMVLGPIRIVGSQYGDITEAERLYPNLMMNERWHSYTQASWLLIAILVSVSVSAGYRLWKVHFPESVRFAMWALWIVGPAAVVAQVLLVGWSLDFRSFDFFEPDNVGSLVGSIIVAGIWTLYLKKSVRVKNTYYREVYAYTLSNGDGSEGELFSEGSKTVNQAKTSWWYRKSKEFRVQCFVSACWIVAASSYVLIFSPYGGYMSDDEMAECLFIIAGVPFLLAVAHFAYVRWVR